MKIFTLLILFLPLIAFSQLDADSLASLWKNKRNHDTLRLEALNSLSFNVYARSNPDTAIVLSNMVYDFAEKKGLKLYKSKALMTRGMLLYFKSKFDQAEAAFQEGIQISKEIGNLKEESGHYNNLANIYLRTKNLKKAESMFLEAKAIKEQIKDTAGIANSVSNLGLVQYYKGNYDGALELFVECLAIRKKLNNHPQIAKSLNHIGTIYYLLGDYAKALDYLKKAIDYQERIQDKMGLSGSYTNVGAIYKSRGDYKRAIQTYEAALEIYQELGDKRGEGKAINNLGVIYKIEQDYVKAEEYQRRALEIREKVKDKEGMASSYFNLGRIFLATYEHEKAIEYFEKAKQIYTEIGNKRMFASAILGAATINLRESRYEEALVLVDSVFAMSKEMQDASLIKQCYMQYYDNYNKQKKYDLAEENLNRRLDMRRKDLEVNFAVLSESEKEPFFTVLSKEFELYYDLAISRKSEKPEMGETAYNIALMEKGLLLKSSTAMRNAILKSGNENLIKQYTDWLELKKKISKAYSKGKDIKEMEDKSNELETNLISMSKEFSEINKALNISWEDVHQGLKKGEVAIEFVRYSQTNNPKEDDKDKILYAAIILRQDAIRPEILPLFSEAELEEIIGTFPGNNIAYINQIYGTNKEVKTDLYDLIWAPMESKLKGAKRIFVSPVGLLHKIAFSSVSKKKGVYLCDLYGIETQSSTSKLASSGNHQVKKNSIAMVFGGVKYNEETTKKETWSYLKGTKFEADEVSAILRENELKCELFTGGEASEDQFKENAPKANIVHVATHGFFFENPEAERKNLKKNTKVEEDIAFRGESDFSLWTFVKNKNPLMRSGLVMAGANEVWNRTAIDEGEDGLLTSQEIVGMDLKKTDLVVMSACETGLGDIYGSEGVYGLQRAFKMVGVKHLIMSLWQVPDKETAEFMQLFYTNLFKEMDYKKAFQKTQMEMRKKYDPYFWAAFVMVE